MTRAFCWLALCLAAPILCAADTVGSDELLQQARAAFERGDTQQALELAGRAIRADERNTRGWSLRGAMHAALGKHQEAVNDFTAALRLDPQAAELLNRRGMEQFKLGRIKESIEDFDRYIALRPEQERSHWQRGISYYYAGRYADGAKQFSAYQTYDDNDVENAVWRYLCMARNEGVAKARESLLRIKQDPRVPMMQIYALYKGKLKPEDVLAAARAGDPSSRELNTRLFYAHLYLGLYYEATGDADQAKAHISKAAEEHKIGHYMWDVARVHAQRLTQGTDGSSPSAAPAKSP